MKLLYYFSLKCHSMSICTFMLSHSIRFFCEKRLIYVWFYRGSGKTRVSLPLVSFVCNIPQTYFVLYRLLFLQKNKRRGRTENTYIALLLQENWAAKKERLFLWPIGLHSSVVQASKASSDIQIFYEDNMNKSICSQFHSTTEVKSIVRR